MPLALSFSSPASAQQSQANSKQLKAEFYPEPGCPVEVTGIRSLMDLDPFGAPLASRIYIDYKNISNRPVTAVKFRIRYSDPLGKDRGTFHAPDASPLGPGQNRAQKWKKEGGLYPDISGLMLRVLQVKYADGSTWESKKMDNIVSPGYSESHPPDAAAGQQAAPAASSQGGEPSFDEGGAQSGDGTGSGWYH